MNHIFVAKFCVHATLLLAVLLLNFSRADANPVAQGAQQLFAEPQDDAVVEAVADSVLADRLRAIFANIEGLGALTVAVTEGVVRLGGPVEQPEDRRRAEDITSSLQGVVHVVNRIEAATDVETRLAPAVEKVQEYWESFVSNLPVFIVAILILLLFAMAGGVLKRWPRPARWGGRNRLVWDFVSRLLRGLLVLVGLLLAFDILGITSLMGAVLGTAGIIGLALGFAFQDIVENYLAGMLLSLRRPFSVNDLVRVGEYEGRIVRLTSREVVMLTFEGNHVRLPNAHVFKSPFINYTINPRRLFSINVGVGEREDLKHAMDVGVAALAGMEGVMEDPPPFARVIELGDWAVKIRYHGWVDQREADFLKVRSRAIRLVKEALDDAGIELPAPTSRVLTRILPEPPSADDRPAAVRARRHEDAEEIDVRPDGKLDEQVREELEKSDDENLLTD